MSKFDWCVALVAIPLGVGALVGLFFAVAGTLEWLIDGLSLSQAMIIVLVPPTLFYGYRVFQLEKKKLEKIREMRTQMQRACEAAERAYEEVEQAIDEGLARMEERLPNIPQTERLAANRSLVSQAALEEINRRLLREGIGLHDHDYREYYRMEVTARPRPEGEMGHEKAAPPPKKEVVLSDKRKIRLRGRG